MTYSIQTVNGTAKLTGGQQQGLVTRGKIQPSTVVEVEGFGPCLAREIKFLSWPKVATLPAPSEVQTQSAEKSNATIFPFKRLNWQRSIQRAWGSALVVSIGLAVLWVLYPALVFAPWSIGVICSVILGAFLVGVVSFVRVVLEALALFLGGQNGSINRQAQDRGSSPA